MRDLITLANELDARAVDLETFYSSRPERDTAPAFAQTLRDAATALRSRPTVEEVARVIDPSSWGRWDEVRLINYGGHCLNEEPLGRVDDPTCKRWAHASYNDQLPQSLAKADAVLRLFEGGE
jgi:hypothetical protein